MAAILNFKMATMQPDTLVRYVNFLKSHTKLLLYVANFRLSTVYTHLIFFGYISVRFTSMMPPTQIAMSELIWM